MVVDVSFRSRNIAFTEEDERAYCALLREVFPDVRYLDRPQRSYDGPEPPEIGIYTRLVDCPAHTTDVIFDPDWRPAWKKTGKYQTWSTTNYPYPNAYIIRSGRIYQRRERSVVRGVEGPDPPFLADGDIHFRCRKACPGDFKLAAKALRLIGKVATNKRQVHLFYPSLEVIGSREKGSELWIGHDAIRWLREDPERLTGYNVGMKIGVRPMDD